MTRLIPLALAALVAVPAAAQGPAEGVRSPLLRADADGDGAVTREEMMAESADRFARLDTDGDGKLTQAELLARFSRGGDREERRAPPPPPGLARMDADNDGTVTRAEFDRLAADRFARLDRDGNGRLEGAELDRPARPGPPPPRSQPQGE
jgi:hypothetical protein